MGPEFFGGRVYTGTELFRGQGIAPELFRGRGYALTNDVWALGSVLAEMLLLQQPFRANVSARFDDCVSVQRDCP